MLRRPPLAERCDPARAPIDARLRAYDITGSMPTVDDVTREPLFKVSNHHAASCGVPPAIDADDAKKYFGYFANEYGEQALFVFDRESGEAIVRSGTTAGLARIASSTATCPAWRSRRRSRPGSAPAGSRVAPDDLERPWNLGRPRRVVRRTPRRRPSGSIAQHAAGASATATRSPPGHRSDRTPQRGPMPRGSAPAWAGAAHFVRVRTACSNASAESQIVTRSMP